MVDLEESVTSADSVILCDLTLATALVELDCTAVLFTSGPAVGVVDDMAGGVVEDREGSIWLVFADVASRYVDFDGKVVVELFDSGVDGIVVVVEMVEFVVVSNEAVD